MRRAALIGVVLATGCAPTPFVPPPPSPQRVYGVSEVDERPEIVMMPPLPYPAGGGDGVIVIRVVIESSDARFNQAAKDYVRAARFTPGRFAGRPVRVRFEMPVEFKPPTRN